MTSLLVSGLLFVFFGFVSALPGKRESVVILDVANFDQEVKRHNFIVVEFYAPWCGYCKALDPEYEKAAGALGSTGTGVVLAKVDADRAANRPLAQKYGVKGFPTVKIFRNGDLKDPMDYNGPLDAHGIVSFLQRQAGPASTELKTYDDVQAVLDADSVAVVGIFTDQSSPASKAYHEVAEGLRADLTFFHTLDPGVFWEHDEPTVFPLVRVVTTFDEGTAETTYFEVEALSAFVRDHATPAVVPFSQDPKDRRFLTRALEAPSKKVLLFLPSRSSNVEAFRTEFRGVAAAKKDRGVIFLRGDAEPNEHVLKYYGVAQKDAPVIILHDPATDAKYYRTNVTVDDLGAFVDGCLGGREQRRIKSEPVPGKNDEPVRVVVANSFKEMVLNPGKNVLIMFYAPWCGQCKKLEPVYKEVGKAFSKDRNVVIAKMDYTANDLPTNKFSVKGFPTIYFYSKAGMVVQFEGERTKASLIEFVNKQKAAAANESSAGADFEEDEAAAEAAEKRRDEYDRDDWDEL